MSKPPTCNVALQLAEMARRQPNTPAVVLSAGRSAPPNSRYRTMTFAELNAECDAMAHGLVGIGIDRGVRTVLMVPPGRDFFSLVFALFKIGAVPVMVDPGMGVANLGECLKEAQPSAFIGIPKAHLARRLFGWARQSIRIRVRVGGWFPGVRSLKRFTVHERGVFSTANTRPDETAAILFTSGSTGVPKGAVYTHGIFESQVRLLRAMYNIEPGEIDLPTFPLFALFAPALGMTSIVPKMDFTRPASVDPTEIIGAIQDHGCTTMFGSPTLLDTVGRYGSANNVRLPTLRRVITAGASAPADVLERFSSMLRPEVEIVTPYGATESLPVASIGSKVILSETRARTEDGEGVCVGKPAPEMTVHTIKINDEPIDEWKRDLLVRPGEIGEFVVRGPVVTKEYYNRPNQTALAKILDSVTGEVLHRMGDVGWIDEKGRLWFCGRKAHRVSLGYRVLFTEKCEPVFNCHPDVKRTALVGIKKDGEIIPVLCVELLPESAKRDPERIIQELQELGAKHQHTSVIQTFLFHPTFPVDIRHNTKIFREKLALWAAKELR